MSIPSVQEAMDRAGSPMKLLWKPRTPPPAVPVVKPEYAGWREEQCAWEQAVAFYDLSHHMFDTVIEGPDTVRMLSYISANNYEKFAIGQAKQFIPVSPDGHLIQDGILLRLGADKFHLIGIGTAENWVRYHAKARGYDVRISRDPTSDFRNGADPVLFRFQVQGPKAEGLLSRLFGSQLDGIKFFHFKEIQLEGRIFNALRHGMAGQAGFEFFGPWKEGEYVRNRILEAGKADGIVQVGGRAYYTAGVDSGWLATPVPAIYTSPELRGFREFVSLYSYEGMNALQGSYFSPNIEDYYHSPYELGYGRSISLNHDFNGRDALLAGKDKVRRSKVTLVWNGDDVNRVFGADHGFLLHYSKDRVEAGSRMVGMSEYMTFMAPSNAVHSLAVIDNEFARPGTELTVVWGQHPGPDAGPDYREDFQRIRVVVRPAPYSEYARTIYRAD